MMFIDNKYTKWYKTLIEHRQANERSGYVEKHHIIPRSMGGSNEPSNIVKLAAREHFVCHRLLVKMTMGADRRRMAFALHRMMFGTNASKYGVNSLSYEKIREMNSNALRDQQLERFKDPDERNRQIEYARNASKIAAEHNRNNPAFSEKISERSSRLVEEGTHNFLGGELQRTMWKDPEFREKQRLVSEARVSSGTHTFQQPEFIERQREKMKNHWKNMTPDEKTARGEKISLSRRAGHARRVAEKLQREENVK